MSTPRYRPTGSRGTVIVVVLIVVAFASMLLAKMMDESSPEVLLAVREADAARLRGDARNALEITLSVLEDFRVVDGGLFAPAQGWSAPLDWAGIELRRGVGVKIDFEEESGKLSLPRLSHTQLAAVLRSIGLGGVDATQAADSLFGWMHAGQMTAGVSIGASEYLPGDPPRRLPGRPIRSFDELAAVPHIRDRFFDQEGRPTDLLRRFQARVSIYDFAATNVNAASPEVFEATGATSMQVRAAGIRGREDSMQGRAEYTRSVDGIQGGDAVWGTQVQCLWVHVSVRDGAASYHLSALVAPRGAARLSPPVVDQKTEGTKPESGHSSEQTEKVRPSIEYPFVILALAEGPQRTEAR